MPTFQSFKDINISFNKHPNTSDLLVAKNEQAIKIALQNLIMTKKGERPFNSDLGSTITRLLFEVLDYGTAGSLRSEIEFLIRKWERRINLLDVVVTPEYDQNAFSVYIEYEIIGRERPDAPLTTEFLLERTR